VVVVLWYVATFCRGLNQHLASDQTNA
jgi:hypothetical protein